MVLPNFFVVGAMKSATTSLYDVLKQHPDVYMSPIKEPHHFCKDITCCGFNDSYRKRTCFNIDSYLKNHPLPEKHISFIGNRKKYLELFREVRNEKLVGEVSNGYLVSKVAHKEIFEFNSKAKIVILLRNPIERAFSHWMMEIKNKPSDRNNFLSDVKKDFEIENKGWGKSELYIDAGLYYTQIKRYLDSFPKDQVFIAFFDDLKDDPSNFYKKLFNFLSIESSIDLDYGKKSNVAFIPKYRFIYYFLKNSKASSVAKNVLGVENFQKLSLLFKSNKNLPKISRLEREALLSFFIDDIKNLESLIGRDLSNWYKF